MSFRLWRQQVGREASVSGSIQTEKTVDSLVEGLLADLRVYVAPAGWQALEGRNSTKEIQCCHWQKQRRSKSLISLAEFLPVWITIHVCPLR